MRTRSRASHDARLAQAVGLDLSVYDPEHVALEVRRALSRERIASEVELVDLLAARREPRERLRHALVGGRSGLFSDPAQFHLLERVLLPPLLADGRLLTVWSAGCGDGSDLYSVAIVLHRLGALERSLLVGSDVLEENLDAARRGEYDTVSMAQRLRDRVRWEHRDLAHDGAPRRGWRLVLCRNVGACFALPTRRRVHATLAGVVAPGGVLLLGSGERIADAASLGLERVAPSAYRRPELETDAAPASL